MKIKRFQYLNKKRKSPFAMRRIVKEEVLPLVGISFDGLAFQTIKSVPVRILMKYPLWEVHLNVLIQEYDIPVDVVEEAVIKGIGRRNKAIRKSEKIYI